MLHVVVDSIAPIFLAEIEGDAVSASVTAEKAGTQLRAQKAADSCDGGLRVGTQDQLPPIVEACPDRQVPGDSDRHRVRCKFRHGGAQNQISDALSATDRTDPAAVA